MLQEEVQLGMTAGVNRDFKQRHEDVLQHLLEIRQLLLRVVHVAGEVAIKHYIICSLNNDSFELLRFDCEVQKLYFTSLLLEKSS